MDLLIGGLTAFSVKDNQNCMAILNVFESTGVTDIRFVRQRLQSAIDSKYAMTVTRSGRYKSDNITTCGLCGGPAAILPLKKSDRSPTATHAIQCQNRPANDQPWQDGMCGNTEYIVQGDR